MTIPIHSHNSVERWTVCCMRHGHGMAYALGYGQTMQIHGEPVPETEMTTATEYYNLMINILMN